MKISETDVHTCGGQILTGDHDGSKYYYCNDCRAFVHSKSPDVEMPAGTDEHANREAWDAGAESSR